MRNAILILLLLSLSACGASLRDPLAIGPMMQRCLEIAERGEKPETIGPLPFLPVLACR